MGGEVRGGDEGNDRKMPRTPTGNKASLAVIKEEKQTKFTSSRD